MKTLFALTALTLTCANAHADDISDIRVRSSNGQSRLVIESDNRTMNQTDAKANCEEYTRKAYAALLKADKVIISFERCVAETTATNARPWTYVSWFEFF